MTQRYVGGSGAHPHVLWRHPLVRWPRSGAQSGQGSCQGKAVVKPWREQVQMTGKRARDWVLDIQRFGGKQRGWGARSVVSWRPGGKSVVRENEKRKAREGRWRLGRRGSRSWQLTYASLLASKPLAPAKLPFWWLPTC